MSQFHQFGLYFMHIGHSSTRLKMLIFSTMTEVAKILLLWDFTHAASMLWNRGDRACFHAAARPSQIFCSHHLKDSSIAMTPLLIEIQYTYTA